LSLPSSVSVMAGESVSFPVTVGLVSGTTQSVSFSVSDLPSGVTATFSPSRCWPGCASTLTITTSDATAGSYPITVTGTSGSVSHTASLSLTVIDPASSIKSGLIGYWLLDEGAGLTTYDSSGNGN